MRFSLLYKKETTKHKNRTQEGFSLVELLIIAPFVVLMIGAFIALAISLTGEVLVSQARNTMIFSHQDALDRIQNDVELSTNFLPESDIAITSPQGYNDSTQNFSNVGTLGDMLILKTLLTTENPLSANREVIYMKDAPNACTSAAITANPLMYGVVVYFVKNDTLWRRTILPGNYTTAGCDIPWQLPSCNPSITNAFCKVSDVQLITGITSDNFEVSYYPHADSTTEDSDSSDPSLSAAARRSAMNYVSTAAISITSTRKVAGKDITYSSQGRSTKVNNPVD